MSAFHDCQVCGTSTEIEAVWMPSEISRLAAMLMHHPESETWPSLWLCQPCIDASALAFLTLGELRPELVVQVTTTDLLGACEVLVRYAAEKGAS